MKVEVGQYFRTKYKRIRICTNEELDRLIAIKVANTPQELIQVGDLVFYGDEILIPEIAIHKLNILGNKCIEYREYWTLEYKYITKILTPNANGGYDLQWEAEK